ncbi:MAG: tetratricopeptide repeat protein [Pirellulales bacterium]
MRGPSAIRTARLGAATSARFANVNRLGLAGNRFGLNGWNNPGFRGRPGAWGGVGRNSFWNRYGGVWNRAGFRFWRPYYRPFAYGWNRWGWGWNRWWPWWRLWIPGLRYWPYYGYGYGGYGYGGGYYGYPTYSYQTACPDPLYYNQYADTYAPTYDQTQVAADQAAAPTDANASASGNQFADQGETQFRAGQFGDAAQSFRHALVEDPQNGVLVQLLAQSLFASGNYEEAAGAVQQSLMMLPQEQWGVVPSNVQELYSSQTTYDDQIAALEKAVSGSEAKPAERFLLAYQLGFRGQRQAALAQLAQVQKAAPDDQAAQRLTELFSKAAAPSAPANSGTLPPPRPRLGAPSTGRL